MSRRVRTAWTARALALALLAGAPVASEQAPVAEVEGPDWEDISEELEPVIEFLDSDEYAVITWRQHVVITYFAALGRPPTWEELLYLDHLREHISLPRSEVLLLALQDGQIEPNEANFEEFVRRFRALKRNVTRLFASTRETRRWTSRRWAEAADRVLERHGIDPAPPSETRSPEAAPADSGAGPGALPLSLSPTPPIPQVDHLVFFGFLHSHSALSDGQGTPQQAYQDAKTNGLDFFALTDHGERLVVWPWEPKEWPQLRSAADAADAPGDAGDPDAFAALWGFEWSNPLYGHVNLIQSEDFTHTLIDLDLDELFDWLNNRPAAFGRFNHPGEYDHVAKVEFQHLWHPELDLLEQMVGLEVWNKKDGLAEYHDKMVWNVPAPTYLAQGSAYGWRLGVLGGQDNHQMKWGSLNDFRVGALVPDQPIGTHDLTRDSIAEAYRARRIYATEDKDLELQVWAAGHPMGSKLVQVQPKFKVKVCDGSQDEVDHLRLYRDGDLVREVDVDDDCPVEQTLQDSCGARPGRHSYTVMATLDNGDRALSSPTWVTWPELPVQPLRQCPEAPPTFGACLPSAQELSDFNQWMACLGPRFSGTPEHEALLTQIEASMTALGPQFIHEKVERWFVNWQADPSGPTLALGQNAALPAAGYMPFSGLTSAAGITGELVYEEVGSCRRHFPLLNLLNRLKFKKAKHEGKVVAIELPAVGIPKWLLKYLARSGRSDFGNWEPYKRMIALESMAPCLDRARAAGAKGVIGVLGMSADHAADQYLPFAREPDRPIGEGVPGIYVDSTLGAALKQHAQQAQRNVTLTLEGAVECCAKTRHLIYTLPGANFGTPSDEIVLVQTHTDGPSALEENGPVALLALASHFLETPQQDRKRTLVFLFASGHVVKQIEGAKDLIWEQPPAWFARTRAAVAIEHLGATEWIDTGAGYQGRTHSSTGEPLAELSLLFVTTGGDTLEELAHTHISGERRILLPARKRLKKLFNRDFFGEGQYVSCTGVPTLGYVPTPSYLLSYADPGGPTRRGHFEKLDPHRMRAELADFRDLVYTLMTDDLAGWPSVQPDVSRCKAPKDPCD